ncbi:amino acid permease [Oxynema aestuarii]|jgi:solute carrier family 12 sodium/potassium/chloride transporter 2|uniref:Amino acid permease n=1 Tax=Oxynema aestuarii AP17 TaxID=2064643 RepID=A0A6H1U3Z1_9CYAN|nr:amino acid permease [Oxynema aestuarii]QIZ72870.1 amino acid permease [Oxynema aestuarii AP17]RMH74404.1 MAG: amino acid permease [Cyanobacteria bacterium J007]
MPKFPFFGGSKPNNPVNPPNTSGSGLGTFGGVYTPSILTILGVIMYLRFGWVVGNVGLIGTLIIVSLSTSITFLTSLSVSAIATDRVVRTGGAYYMISRSLGIETGGAVGIPLYFAQALSVALYTIGFAESIVESFPESDLKSIQRLIALVTTVAVAFLALKSARTAIRAQYFIMAAIVLSLISFAFGHPLENTTIEMWGAKPENSEDFWVVFAVFFPAVTGIMAGVSMSGDLRDPARSIPIGTLAAVGTGYVIYMGLPILLATRADAITLIENPLIMKQMAFWGPAISLGVWGATLSSALGSILGAPRVMQALARDGILPGWLRVLGTGKGADDEPFYATLVTLGIAVAAVAVGDLNIIAPVLTMFFLTTYLVLNVAAAIEGFLQSPSFRPAFRVHWVLSLFGAIGCMGVMLLIDPIATVIAASIVLGVYLWLERRELESAWGDVRRGLWMEVVRTGLFNLSPVPDTKNWRPHLLVLSGAPTRRWVLVELAMALTHNRGMVTVSSVLPTGARDAAQQAELETTIREYLERRGVQALVRVITAPDPFVGARRLIETYGLGPLVPNTILLGDSEEPSRRDRYCETIATIHQAKRNVVILRENVERGFGRRRRIDVWWGGLQANGGLMLILAYLVRTSAEWRNAQVHLKLVVPNASAARDAEPNLKALVAQLRIGAIPQVIVADGKPFNEILHESSASADLVFLGMASPGEQFTEYYENLQAKTSGLPTTIFVLAAPDFAFEEVLTEGTT